MLKLISFNTAILKKSDNLIPINKCSHVACVIQIITKPKPNRVPTKLLKTPQVMVPHRTMSNSGMVAKQ